MTRTDTEILQVVKGLLDVVADYMTELAKRDITVSFGLQQSKEGTVVTNYRATKVVMEPALPVQPLV